MTFIILVTILAGLSILFAGIQDESIINYINSWIGNVSK